MAIRNLVWLPSVDSSGWRTKMIRTPYSPTRLMKMSRFQHVAPETAQLGNDESITFIEFDRQLVDSAFLGVFERRDFHVDEFADEELVALGVLQEQVTLLLQILGVSADADVADYLGI